MALSIKRGWALARGRHGGFLGWKGAIIACGAAASWRLLHTAGNVRAGPIFRRLSIDFRSISFLSATTDSMVSSLVPPQPALSWDHSPQDIKRLTADLIAKDRAVSDNVGALKPDECNFKSVSAQYIHELALTTILRFSYVQPDYPPVSTYYVAPQIALADAENEFDGISEPLSFYQNVSPSKELRDASNEAEVQIRDFSVESSMRLDVFQAKVNAEKNLKASGEWDKLSSEEKRLVERMVRFDYDRHAMALS